MIKITCTAGLSRKLSNTVIMSILEGLPGNSKAERLQNDFAHLISFLLALLLLHAFVSDPWLRLIWDGACFSRQVLNFVKKNMISKCYLKELFLPD